MFWRLHVVAAQDAAAGCTQATAAACCGGAWEEAGLQLAAASLGWDKKPGTAQQKGVEKCGEAPAALAAQ